MNGEQKKLDELVGCFYRCFDNRNGKRPDLDFFKSLFIEGATISKKSEFELEQWTLIKFWQPRETLLVNGSLKNFHEWETAYESYIHHDIAMRQSFYSKYGDWSNQPYSGRGVKHFQFVKEKGTWKIYHILWQDLDEET